MADFEERTEQATPRRRQKAREKGQVPRSRDLGSMAAIGALLVVFTVAGGFFVERIKGMMVRLLTLQYGSDPFTVLRASSMETMVLVLPMLGIATAAAVGATVAQGGFFTKAPELDLNRLNPFSGIQKLFSIQGLVELIKSVLKFFVGGVLLYYVMKRFIPDLPGLMGLPLRDMASASGSLLLRAVFYAFFCYLLISAVDYVLERWRFERSIRMSHVEVKEEHKESEGNPLIKSRVRSIQREMARRRMMQEVPRATVVVTNPTHLAVALRYEDRKMKAPLVVAKGAGVVAGKIRDVARKHGVPIIEDKPLARLLFTLELNTFIPDELYRAVARILALILKPRGGKS